MDPDGNFTYTLSPSWTSTTDSFGWRYLYQGMWRDPVTGLYYTPNRDYSAELARWMEQDPDAYINGGDLYQFFTSCPGTRLDPIGAWAVLREGASTATAISAQGDTIWSLVATLIRLNPDEWDKWLTFPTTEPQTPGGLNADTPLDSCIGFAVPREKNVALQVPQGLSEGFPCRCAPENRPGAEEMAVSAALSCSIIAIHENRLLRSMRSNGDSRGQLKCGTPAAQKTNRNGE